jgi:hypothetical protein
MGQGVGSYVLYIYDFIKVLHIVRNTRFPTCWLFAFRVFETDKV